MKQMKFFQVAITVQTMCYKGMVMVNSRILGLYTGAVYIGHTGVGHLVIKPV